MIGNSLYQPDAQDPLGLTRAQWEANPRQADPAATLFDTRKTVNQQQGGATLEQRSDDTRAARDRLRRNARACGSTSRFPASGATSSGGVTDLDRTFGGVDAR